MAITSIVAESASLTTSMTAPTPQPTAIETQPFSPRWRWIVIAAILLVILSEISGNILKLDGLTATSPHLQFLMLCAAMVCLAYAFADKQMARTGIFSHIRHHGLLILIFLFALLIRLWHNGDAIRVLVDEMNFLSGMTNFWKPDPIGILTPMDNISPFTWLFPYWQSNFVALFGRNLAALRAVSAVVGALTIPALYLLAATLFNRKTALAAAFLLAVFPPHIHFSRIALLSITDPLMGTLALAFLARGMCYRRPFDYALVGIFFGLTQYFFEGGRLLYIPLAVVWWIACWLFVRNETDASQTSKRQPLIPHYALLITLFLVAAPVYYTLFAIQKPLTGRMDASGLGSNFWNEFTASPWEGGLRYVVNHLSPAIRIYALQPDQTTYYGGDTALILPLLVPFFVVGLILIFRRIRSAGALLLLLWLLTVSAGNSLLLFSAASTRYVVVFPALALITALGLVAVVQWLTRMSQSASPRAEATRLPKHTSPLKGLVTSTNDAASTESFPQHSVLSTQYFFLLITILTLLGLYQLGYYFGTHLGDFDARFRAARPGYDLEDAVYRTLDFPPNTQVHIISQGRFDVGYGLRLAAFFRDDLPTDGYRSDEVDIQLLSTLPRTVDQVFFLETEDIHTLALLQSAYKSALEGPFFSPYNVAPEKHFVMFSVRRQP